MATILRESFIFGPVQSRRLGISLGINILPIEKKICNYNCVYCECGWNNQSDLEISDTKIKFPQRLEIAEQLKLKLTDIVNHNESIDVITFSGNGEPTLHPDFLGIIEDTISIRNDLFPSAKISVLSNATNLQKQSVIDALLKVDNPILKLDSANILTLQNINLPKIKNEFGVMGKQITRKITVEKIADGMKKFDGNFIMQIMFLRGENDYKIFDNTTDDEINSLIKIMKLTNPRQVMIYPIDRETPSKSLIKLNSDEMKSIADKISKNGFNVMYV
jgi:wyosine [tRNA(Phe)-imidazoG37] synthetase (radical SAM superfamily)